MADTPTTDTPDVAKLTTQANELRGAMVEALGKADDSTVRKLGNELAAVNKSILDLEVTSQGNERQVYMEAMHDTLNEFEKDGLTLTVKFAVDGGVSSVVFAPTDAIMTAIKAAVAGITRPSSAVKWQYGRDEEGHQAFDFGGTTRRMPATGTSANGQRNVGWTAPNGNTVSLGDAFDAIATATEKTELGTKSGGSATHAYKSKVITAGGYKKN